MMAVLMIEVVIDVLLITAKRRRPLDIAFGDAEVLSTTGCNKPADRHMIIHET
jgi:hypothetical protein